jgi:RND family efflux transporter MFP subunit
MIALTSTIGRKTTQVLARPRVAAISSSGTTFASAKPTAGFRSRHFAWATALVLLMGAAAYFRQHSRSDAAEQPGQSGAALRSVSVTRPVRLTTTDIVVPATMQAYQETDLFARANGYLKAWRLDIGSPVKKGQVLAEIETPELDQELAQSIALLKQGEAEHQQAKAEREEAVAELVLTEANVAKVKATLDFSTTQANRYKTLVQSQTVSKEEYEGAVRDYEARKAELASTQAEVSRRKANLETRLAIIDSKAATVRNREANVQRLRDLTGFQKVVAPFDGIVTRRHAEVGMLVTAGSNTGTRPLFSVAQVDVLRMQAAVPQSGAMGIRAGDEAQVTIPELPGRVFAAKVARTAGAVEPASRSLLVEVELPNPRMELLPGVYAQARFQSHKTQANLAIGNQALLMRSTGPHVVVVAPDGAIRIGKVTLGRDFGTSVEVLSGLNGDEQLVLNPTDDLRDGQTVQVAETSDSRNQIARK